MSFTLRNYGDVPLGQGYNSISGAIRGNPFRSRVVAPPNSSAYRTEFELKWVESSYELVTSLGISASAGWGSGSASASFAEKSKINRFNSYILVSARVFGPSEFLEDDALTEAARALLENGDGPFFRQFGNFYVWRRRTGGEFFALLSIQTLSETEKQSVKAKVSASMKVLNSAVEFRSSFSEVSSSKDIQFSVIKNGGNATQPEVTAEAVLEQALHFTEEIVGTPEQPGRAAILELELLDYETVGADLSALRAIQLEIENLAKTRWQLWDHINDIEVLEELEARHPGTVGRDLQTLYDWKTKIADAIEAVDRLRDRTVADPFAMNVQELRDARTEAIRSVPAALDGLQVVTEEKIDNVEIQLAGTADYRRVRGDSEMDTRPGRQTGIDITVQVRVDSSLDPRHFLVDVTSRHREESHPDHTTFEARKSFRFSIDIPANALFEGLQDDRWNHSSRKEGRNHSWVNIAPSGMVREASVKFDGEGRNDRDDQGCRLSLRLRYRLAIFRSVET
ncbi:MAG: hypothetical protein H7A53_01190 [Akkermansiaceae bacterium]|nr:hypothetical protein [Akkermansiaceae bacterium]MCP5549500.1 hypothetical protein [Akkermansiaceae bacterium]